jgi:hypothetical protein
MKTTHRNSPAGLNCTSGAKTQPTHEEVGVAQGCEGEHGLAVVGLVGGTTARGTDVHLGRVAALLALIGGSLGALVLGLRPLLQGRDVKEQVRSLQLDLGGYPAP